MRIWLILGLSVHYVLLFRATHDLTLWPSGECVRLYDAAILTLCYTQHALWPYIDSEINHIRHFIKIQFVNKGIEFINLPSIN